MSNPSPWTTPSAPVPPHPAPHPQQPSGQAPYGRHPYGPYPYGQPLRAYPPPAYQPPPRRGRPVVLALVVGLVCLLVGVLLGVGGTLAVQAWGADPDAGRPAAEVVPERMPGIVAWIEERTGHEFASEPEVTVLDDAAFEAALLEVDEDAEGSEPATLPTDDWTSTVTALGLVEDPAAFDAFGESGFADGVVGFYSYADESVVVRGTEWSPMVEVTLLHELVHALQDQVVDLEAVTASTRLYDESYAALSAVIEGQATLYEYDWLDEQSPAYADEYWSTPGGGGPSEPFAEASAYLPYTLGYWGTLMLEEAEGSEAVFDALREPPTTLEQLWDMPGWAAGTPTAADPEPLPDTAAPDGAEVLDRGSFGVHGLSLLTLDPQDYASLPEEESLPLEGWAGDAYVTWADGDGACTRVVVRTDGADDAASWRDGLAGWAQDGGTVSTRDEQVVLERCTT